MDNIMEIQSVKKHFPIYEGIIKKQVGSVKAVHDINLQIPRGKTIAVVGESGSGKTTLIKTIMRFYKPTDGKITFEGKDITNLSEQQLKPIRQHMQMVHQDPTSSLNPRKRIADILEEPLIVHKYGNRRKRQERVQELIELVELPKTFLTRYPHSLSGGQKQRIGIARALALNPKLICLDEPTASLDVSVQARIIALLERLQRELGLTYIFITHDLSLVNNFADYVAVMYLGEIMEYADVKSLYTKPLNPYTQSLLSSIPVTSKEEQSMLPMKIKLKGEIPSPRNIPKGCSFNTRCPFKQEICESTKPNLESDDSSEHLVRCHLYEEIMKMKSN